MKLKKNKSMKINNNYVTYSQAIEMVMKENEGFASLNYIYKNIEKYRVKTGKTPHNTIQERVQRDPRFTRIAYGEYALTEIIENIEKYNIGKLVIKDDKVVFLKNKKVQSTEKIADKKIRIGQNNFRLNLLKKLKICPITSISDQRLLIASHIKPWAFCDNEERLNLYNGFLLSPLYYRLFDKSIGLITFTNDKRILISNNLSLNNRNKLSIKNGQKIDDLPIRGRKEFLDFHRKYIFKG